MTDTERNKHIQERSVEIADLLRNDDAGDSISALLNAIGEQLTYMCPDCRRHAGEWLKAQVPKVLENAEAFVREHGEPEACATTPGTDTLH